MRVCVCVPVRVSVCMSVRVSVCVCHKDSSFSVSLGTPGFPSVQPQMSHVSTAGVCYFPECHAAVGRSGVGILQGSGVF